MTSRIDRPPFGVLIVGLFLFVERARAVKIISHYSGAKVQVKNKIDQGN